MTEITPIGDSPYYYDDSQISGDSSQTEDPYQFDADTTVEVVKSITDSLIVSSLTENSELGVDLTTDLVSLNILNENQNNLINLAESSNEEAILATETLSEGLLDPFFASYSYFDTEPPEPEPEPEGDDDGIDLLA